MEPFHIENRTPFVFEPLVLADEELRPLLVPVVKATFDIGRDGRCTRAESQVPLCLAGECWGKDPASSSYRYEPEGAFAKPATDVALIGHAYAGRRDTRELLVSLRVGPLGKTILVQGDRVWFKTLGIVSMTKPATFEQIPLVYERAFGGWDRDHADPHKHSCELRNPVGVGYRRAGGFVDGIRLPNLEDPKARIKSLTDRPQPAGFGFVSPHWQPRVALAGTYDEAWREERAPRLPEDFDRRHLNAASPGLVAPGYLRGDESVTATGVHREGPLTFSLPGMPPPKVEVTRQRPAAVPMVLDTVIIEPDLRRVLLLWRGQLLLPRGPHDVRAIVATLQAPTV